MIVNGYSYSTVKRDVLDWWLRRLTWLSSFSYGMRQSGELINLEDEELISAAKAARGETYDGPRSHRRNGKI